MGVRPVAILAFLRALVHRATSTAPIVVADDAELLAVADAMGVVRDLTPALAAPALAGAR
jgi:hypothetical protein